MIETASFEGELYAAPFNTNTQLLWYRKDLVKQPPTTWDEMIDQAERLGPDNAGTIQVQANRYEGFTVWANALIESAGTQLLSGPETVELGRGADRRKALEVMGRLANSSAPPRQASRPPTRTPPGIGFETGESAFMTNYTFAYASAKAEAPDIAKTWASPASRGSTPTGRAGPRWAASTSRSAPSRRTRTSPSTRRPAWPGGKSQLTAVELDGLPPSRSDLYTDKVVTGAYPGFAGLVKKSIEGSGPRPTRAGLPGRLARRCSAPCTRPTRSTPRTPAPSTRN